MKSAATANQIQINKEAVKLLVIQHGQREAARLAGLNEDTVCSWAKRYGWSVASKPQARTGNTPAVERITDVLAERKAQSRSLLSQYQIRAATEAAAHEKPLSITRQVNDLASIHSKVWPEEQSSTQVFSLNVLNLSMLDESE